MLTFFMRVKTMDLIAKNKKRRKVKKDVKQHETEFLSWFLFHSLNERILARVIVVCLTLMVL